MRILGIDPGSINAGYAVIESSGQNQRVLCFGTLKMKGEDYNLRLLDLGTQLSGVFIQWQPQFTIVEKVFFGKSADSAFKLGQARGVVLYEASKNASLIREYATRAVKKGITGHGDADKQSVKIVLQSLLQIKDLGGYDASDAMALAVYGAQQLQAESTLLGLQL